MQDVHTAKMVELWQAAFKTEWIEASTDFFEIGGTSLDAIRLVVEIESVFGVRLDIPDLFDYPTAQQLTQLVVDRQGDTGTG